MSRGYTNFEHQDRSNSDVDINQSSIPPTHQPVHYQQPYQVRYQQPVNILEGYGYKLYQAQDAVATWAKYIKIFGYICIIFGGMKAFGGLLSLLFIDDEIDVDGPGDEGDITMPIVPLYAVQLIDCARGVATLLLGMLCLKTSKNPTRVASWILFKKAIVILLIQFVLLAIMYLFIFCALGQALGEWIDNADHKPEGEYSFHHKQTGHKAKWEKREKPSEGEIDQQDKEGIAAFIFLAVASSCVFACCILTACSGCVLGGVYKFHNTTRELDIISHVTNPRMGELSQVPAYHHGSINSNVVRGQVVMMPPQ